MSRSGLEGYVKTTEILPRVEFVLLRRERKVAELCRSVAKPHASHGGGKCSMLCRFPIQLQDLQRVPIEGEDIAQVDHPYLSSCYRASNGIEYGV